MFFIFLMSAMFERTIRKGKISSNDLAAQFWRNGGVFEQAIDMFDVKPNIETIENNRVLNGWQVSAW